MNIEATALLLHGGLKALHAVREDSRSRLDAAKFRLHMPRERIELGQERTVLLLLMMLLVKLLLLCQCRPQRLLQGLKK
jgi:hypothetical protein